MSSHHFVKDGQEPALLIVDAISFDVAAPLMEWVPLVIVHQNALDGVLQWGIKIDAVITSTHNQSDVLNKTIVQAPVKILTSDVDSWLKTVMDYFTTIRQSGVTIVLSDAFAWFPVLDPFVGKFNITLLTESQKWSAIASGSFRKWLPAGHILLIHSQSPVETPGLTRSGDRYTVLSDGVIILTSGRPFWVGEPLQG